MIRQAHTKGALIPPIRPWWGPVKAIVHVRYSDFDAFSIIEGARMHLDVEPFGGIRFYPWRSIPMPIPKDYQRLEHSNRQIRPNAKRVGPADPNEVISITIAVRRRPGGPALPSQEDWANLPPGKRRYVTSEEFTDKFGRRDSRPRPGRGICRQPWPAGGRKNAAQRIVIASGKVSQVSKAFAVELGHYEGEPLAEEERKASSKEKAKRGKNQPERETYRGYEGDLSMPADVGRVVEGVFGLDNRRMIAPHRPDRAVSGDHARLHHPRLPIFMSSRSHRITSRKRLSACSNSAIPWPELAGTCRPISMTTSRPHSALVPGTSHRPSRT